jgi:hypothetical protein
MIFASWLREGSSRWKQRSSSARAFFAAECQQWQPVAVGPENGHRRHLSYNSPKNSSFLAAQGQIEQVQD